MTKDIVVGDELPDWVGAKEFYQKYDPKEVIGRWVQQK